MNTILKIAVLLSALSPTVAEAGKASAVLKGLRSLVAPTARAAGRETAEHLGRQALAASAREAAEAVFKRSAVVAIRQFPAAARTVPSFADDFARASARLSSQSSRRLAQLAPELEAAGASANLIKHLGSAAAADDLIGVLWRHKGKLAAALAAGIVVIHGDAVVESAGAHIAQPLIEHVAAPIGRGLGYVVIPCLTICILISALAITRRDAFSNRLRRLIRRVRHLRERAR